ncbi:hypothetical protein LCGC14_2667570 [marine sediment metagenome]|uniref:DUF559 domain-containing protein n=1 Tax=marine sediment metagenome TaxID=412755 RepID=A0A0F9ACH1_9ZZZZ
MTTSIELKMKDILKKINIDYIYQYNFKDAFACDFAIQSLKLIIECDGCYWHSCTKHHPKANITNDKERDKYTKHYGWKTLRFWEHDINDKPEKCFKKIRDTIQKCSKMTSKSFN